MEKECIKIIVVILIVIVCINFLIYQIKTGGEDEPKK